MGCCDLTLRHTTISVEEQKRRERRRRQRQRCFDLFKKFIAFLFSHIGLCALVVGYSIMGGFLFRALEAGNEMAENMKIIDFKEKKIREIYDVAKNTDSRKKYEKYSNFSREVRKILIEFQVNVISAVKDKGWDGKDRSPDDEMDLQWSFAGALLYAVTVITTIGYGHVAPKTTWGRLVTILYALIGIPLTFLYLSNIGTFLAEGFRLVYKKVCCDLCCCQKCERKRKRQRERIRRLRHLQAEAKSGQLMRALSVKKSPPTNIVVANECMQNTSAETTIEPLPFFPDKDNIINEAEEILGPAPAYDDHLPLQPNEKDNSNPDMGNNAHLSEFKTNPNIKEDNADEQKGKEQSVENSKLKRKESSKKKRRWTLRSRRKKKLEQSKSVPSDMEMLSEPEDAKRSLSTQDLLSGQDIPEYGSIPTSPSSAVFSLSAMIPNVESQVSVNSNEFFDAASHLGSVCDISGLKNIDSVQETDILDSHEDLYDGAVLDLNELSTVKETDILDDNFEEETISDVKETAILDSETESETEVIYRKGKPNKTPNSKYRPVVPNVATVLPIVNPSLQPDSIVISALNAPKERSAYMDVEEAEEGMGMDTQEYTSLQEAITVIQHDIESVGDMSEDEKVTVPISICLVLIAGYIFGGSMLFTLWEDWDYLTGSYFCFITLSTIGFGDIVPGTDMKEWDSQEKLVLCAMYLAFGLSLLAMCFNLMQEEVKEKCKWFGQKVGLLKDSNEG